MKTKLLLRLSTILLVGFSLMLVGCDQSNEPMGKGEVEFQITDAPSDDASIKGVIVTIADIQVNGNSVAAFTRQTVDLKALQDGKTKSLITAQLDAKAYDQVTLILDMEQDAMGNAPGCYVLTTDDVKYKLGSHGSLTVVMNKEWSVVANGKSIVVMDFDIRKCVRTMQDPAILYQFVSHENMQAAVRLVRKDNTGTIHGDYSEQSSVEGDKIIVYAYKHGEFNANTETQATGEDGILFKNAVTSAEVKEGLTTNNFTLSFLEKGDYELHFAAYKKTQGTDRFVFQSMLKAQLSATGSVGEFITVQNGITLNVSSVITGTL